MKILKLAIVFAAGVIFTLYVTGNLPTVPRIPDHIKLGEDTAVGIAGLIALILAVAFIASRASNDRDGALGKSWGTFRASETDYWLGGICGGLGKATPVPAWVWRLGFAIAFFYYGTGGLLYILLWIFVPNERTATDQNTPSEPDTHGFFGFLRGLHRSTTDRWLGGVCGGLAKGTVIPAWIWRVAFVVLNVGYGAGFGFYILLWICLPKEKDGTRGPAEEPFNA